MAQYTPQTREMQEQRLKIKQLGQQMQNLATEGAGLFPCEARELVRIIDEVYFQDPDLKQILPGQMKYSCVSITEPLGKPIKDCQMVTVTLTILHDEDTTKDKDASIETRWRRLLRICDEAREQGGLLSQEDLSKLLMSDVLRFSAGESGIASLLRLLMSIIGTCPNFLEKFLMSSASYAESAKS